VLTCWLCSVFYPLRTQIDFDLVDRTIPVQGALSALTLSQPCQHTTALFAPCQHKTYTVVRKNQHIRNQHVPKHHNNSSSWCLGISVVFIHIVCQPNLFSNCSIPLNLDGRCVSQPISIQIFGNTLTFCASLYVNTHQGHQQVNRA
jgi:hypothetical protein